MSSVDIHFECLPLRSVPRLDVPLDASPEYAALVARVKAALEKHGSHNTYYLYTASCVFHLTNSDDVGMLEFSFEGTVMTGPDDLKAERCDLSVELRRETCDWLTEPVAQWFKQTVEEAVRAEFDRYIAAGDLDRTVARLKQLEAESDAHGGFVGFGL